MRRLAALLVLLHASGARAYPFLALRPGGTPFEGPTDPELSAIWWNPAALGQLRGWNAGGVGEFVLSHGTVARDPICSAPGPPGDCATPLRSFPAASFLDPSGTGLAGLSWDFRSENVAVALAAYTPWESHRSFDAGAGAGSGSAPTAYHLRAEDFTTLYVGLGAAFRLSRAFSVGVNVAFADSWASMSFDRDAALEPHCPSAARAADGSCGLNSWPGGSATVGSTGYENPAYAERIRVRGSGGQFWGFLPVPTGLSVGLGALARVSERVVLGASWSRMFPLFSSSGRYGSGSVVGAEVDPAAAAGAPCPGGVCRGSAAIDYDIPDVYHLGARVQLRQDLELSTWARLVMYGGYQRTPEDRALVVRLSGDPVDKGGLPGTILIGRSLVPAFAAEIGLRWRVRPWLRLGGSIIFETSAVPGGAVDAEAIDGPKLDAMIGAEWRVARVLRLYAGYEFTGIMFSSLNTPAPGVYDPSATVRCVDRRYSLDDCGPVLAGNGLPTASGHYTSFTHHFALGLLFNF